MPFPKTTNLFMAGYRKDPPLLPRLPDNQPNFHRQSENIHTRDTHDRPLPKQRRNTRITETPTKPVTTAYFHERRSLNNFHRDRVITFEQIAE